MIKQCVAEKENQEAIWLNRIKKQFKIIAGKNKAIEFLEFKTAFNVKKQFFAERFFTLFDTNKSGTTDLQELTDGVVKLTQGSPQEKLKFLFDVYDVNGSGTIDPDELETVLRSCMEESSMQLSDDAIRSLTMALFKSADEDNNGEITFEELASELERHPMVMENLTISVAQWLSPPEDKTQENIPGFIRYRESNFCVIIARGFGMALNFNCAFVVVLMLRTCMSWLRNTKLGTYHSTMFHKMVGLMIALLSVGHTIAHLGNIAIVRYFSDQVVASSNSTTLSSVTDAPKL